MLHNLEVLYNLEYMLYNLEVLWFVSGYPPRALCSQGSRLLEFVIDSLSNNGTMGVSTLGLGAYIQYKGQKESFYAPPFLLLLFSAAMNCSPLPCHPALERLIKD